MEARAIGLVPIWKTVSATLEDDGQAYDIYADDQLIYSGVAYYPPGEEEASVRLNDICADYLATRLSSLSASGVVENVTSPTFRVVSNENECLSVQFALDWSYDPSHDVSVAAAPIDGIIDPRQKLLHSAYGVSEVSGVLSFADGSTMDTTFPIARTADFDMAFNGAFARSATATTAGTIIIDPSLYDGLVAVELGAEKYTIQSTCKRYALYYLNSFGGWDSFIIQSSDTKEQSFKRSEYTKIANPIIPSDRGRTNYLNEVTTRWSLSTGLMTDAESLKMHHLIGSTSVYLLDMESGLLHSVVVTDSSVTHKTAKNSGRSFPTYTINVELSQPHIRR